MRNRINCTADRLALLDPAMIQSIVNPGAFQIGQQYVSENRVRIVDADDLKVSSAVIGNSGLYEQHIGLQDGHLVTECSCNVPEDPMCRHSIAVLLEYYRWAQPRLAKRAAEHKRMPKPEPVKHEPPQSAPDVKLSDVMTFVEWFLPAVKALDRGESLPDNPRSGNGVVTEWIHIIRGLEERRRESDRMRASLETETRGREAYVARLSQQLQASIEEAKSAQTTLQELQREVEVYKGLQGKLNELTQQAMRLDGRVESVAGELVQKSGELESLARSFKEVAGGLRSLAKTTQSHK
jgi:hypothetical protein